MKGTIYDINPKRGMVAVQTDNGDFSIFEIISANQVEIGQEVSWSGNTPTGSAMITNHGSGERFEVYFQNHWVSRHQLDQQLLRR